MDTHVLIAKKTVEYFVKTKMMPIVENGIVNFSLSDFSSEPNFDDAFPPIKLEGELLNRKAGAFATIHKKDGDLRGCIGTIMATQNCIGQEIVRNAICACSEDPRFEPVRPEELEGLTYSVDVLGELEKISSPDELDVKRYGVIVTNGFRRGLLLPNLDGVDDVQAQIAIARRKGGILPYEDVELQRFEVVRHL